LIGISAVGVYLPAYRLSREIITQATGGISMRGERTVANYDEDALTMGVEASLECIDNYFRSWGVPLGKHTLRGLIFTSTSSPYREKHASSVISSVLEADSSALVTDLNGSLRGALTAISIASNYLKESNREAKVLVVAADKRQAEPESNEEQSFGDGAATLILGQEDVLANIEAHFTVNANFPHFWRRENDTYVHAGDARFVENYGYFPLMEEVIRGLLKKAGCSAAEIDKLIVYTPYPRLAQQLARRLGFDTKTQLADSLFTEIGDTGTAQVFLSLISVLDKARPGNKLVVAGYGDGAEAILLEVTENIQKMERCRGLEVYLKRRRPLTNYGRFLHFRDVIGESSYDAFSSLALLWREEKQNLRLYGTKCKGCGAIHFPRRRVCDKCGTKDEMENFKLTRKGRIYTYTNDYIYLNPDPPETLVVVDLENGGRFFGQGTDVNPGDVRIGMEVELCFRKLHDGQGLPNYFWKARPGIGGK